MSDIRNYIKNIITDTELPGCQQIKLQNKACIFDYLKTNQIFDNEQIVDSLIRDYKLPYIDATQKEIKVLDYSKITEYFKNGYFIFSNQEGNICHAVNNIIYLRDLVIENEKIFLVRKQDFFTLLEKNFSSLNTIKSKYYLDFLSPKATAKNINYRKLVTGFMITYIVTIFLLINPFNLINNLLYLLQNIFKFTLFIKALSNNSGKASIVDSGIFDSKNNDTRLAHSEEYPIYTVFVPLYKEIQKIKSIIAAIDNLDYPKARLDVKFIVEADDYSMIKALTILEPPPYIHIIKVPYSLPRTKPKAMNYAMNYAIGDYLVIYDAEDRPERDQLLKALAAFRNLPPEYACVQARLNFYNADENLLTRLFHIEYSLWFDYLLKGLSLLGLPVTLGGTSNHFKLPLLHKVGYWDAYNVTEDADLGIRLYLSGYKVHIIDSVTLEEAPIELGNWFCQRARWIKGFIQTFIIFFQAKKDYKIFGLTKICSVYIFVGLSTYSFFSFPWIVISSFFQQGSFVYLLWLVNSFFALSYMYSTGFFILRTNKQNLIFSPVTWLALILWPLYFVLHSIASYKALWECLTQPFKWNKTRHGVSAKEVD